VTWQSTPRTKVWALLYSYKNTSVTGTKVLALPADEWCGKARRGQRSGPYGFLLYLLYWYKCTNTEVRSTLRTKVWCWRATCR
jgi:hypothetical protein